MHTLLCCQLNSVANRPQAAAWGHHHPQHPWHRQTAMGNVIRFSGWAQTTSLTAAVAATTIDIHWPVWWLWLPCCPPPLSSCYMRHFPCQSPFPSPQILAKLSRHCRRLVRKQASRQAVFPCLLLLFLLLLLLLACLIAILNFIRILILVLPLLLLLLLCLLLSCRDWFSLTPTLGILLFCSSPSLPAWLLHLEAGGK